MNNYMGYTVFPVYGMEVRVFDEHLCEAIKALSERQRTIVLMSYFLEMSDIKIGEIIGIMGAGETDWVRL